MSKRSRRGIYWGQISTCPKCGRSGSLKQLWRRRPGRPYYFEGYRVMHKNRDMYGPVSCELGKVLPEQLAGITELTASVGFSVGMRMIEGGYDSKAETLFCEGEQNRAYIDEVLKHQRAPRHPYQPTRYGEEGAFFSPNSGEGLPSLDIEGIISGRTHAKKRGRGPESCPSCNRVSLYSMLRKNLPAGKPVALGKGD